MQALKDDLRGAALTAYSGAPGAPRAAACSPPWHLGSASGACPASVCVQSPIPMLGLVGSRDGNQYLSREGRLRVIWAWLGSTASQKGTLCSPQLRAAGAFVGNVPSCTGTNPVWCGQVRQLYPARRCPHLWADGAADTRTGAGGGKFLPPCAPALISWPPRARDRFPLSANISHKTIQLCP